MTGARVQTMLRKKATLAAFLGLHGPGFQKEGLRAIDAIFLRDGTLLQGRAVGWDSTSTSGKTSGERGLGFRRPRHPASSLTPRHAPSMPVVVVLAKRHPGTVPDCLPTQIFNTNPDGSRIRIPHSVWTIALRSERVALVGPCGFFSFAAQSPRPLSGRLGLPAECLETGKKMVPTECAFTQYIALPLSALVRSGPEPTSRKELNAELRRTLQPEKCRCSFSRASLSCQARVDGCYVKRQRICSIPTLVGYQQPDSRC